MTNSVRTAGGLGVDLRSGLVNASASRMAEEPAT